MSLPPKPMARRSHKKSRAGCRQCKERKVKCDEIHPLCGNCSKHFTNLDECDWDPLPTPTKEVSSGSTSTSESQLPSRTRGAATATGVVKSIFGRPLSMKLPIPLTIGNLEPFGTLPESKVPDVEMLMHHYLSTFVHRSFPFFNTNTVVQLWWPFIREDPVLFHVVLLLAALSYEQLTPETDSRRSKMLMTESIRLLKDRVLDDTLGTTDQTIVAVANLLTIEHERGNMRSLQMHIGGLKRMVGLRGGLRAIQETNPMAANIVFWMSMVAMNDSEIIPVEFDRVEAGPPYWLPNAVRDDSCSKDFRKFGVEKAYSNILLEVDDLSQRFSEQLNYASARDGLSVVSQMSDLLQRLLRLAPAALDEPLVASVSESCRYAAALHVLYPLSGHYPDPTLMVRSLIYRLKFSLGPLLVQSEGAKHPLLLWILTVGAVSSLNTPEREWFIGHLVVVAADLDISTWGEMRNQLTTVIWHAIFCDNSFHGVWEEMVQKNESLKMVAPEDD